MPAWVNEIQYSDKTDKDNIRVRSDYLKKYNVVELSPKCILDKDISQAKNDLSAITRLCEMEDYVDYRVKNDEVEEVMSADITQEDKMKILGDKFLEYIKKKWHDEFDGFRVFGVFCTDIVFIIKTDLCCEIELPKNTYRGRQFGSEIIDWTCYSYVDNEIVFDDDKYEEQYFKKIDKSQDDYIELKQKFDVYEHQIDTDDIDDIEFEEYIDIYSSAIVLGEVLAAFGLYVKSTNISFEYLLSNETNTKVSFNDDYSEAILHYIESWGYEIDDEYGDIMGLNDW